MKRIWAMPASIVVPLLGAVLTFAATAAPAGAQEAGPAERVGAPPERRDPWQMMVGVRTTLIRSAAFDRFSSDDALPQLSGAVLRVVAARGRFALSAGVAADLGSNNAPLRNAMASLDLKRASLLADARYCPHPRACAFARLAPGAVRGTATVSDASAIGGRSLSQTFTLPSLDASAGAAFSLGRSGTTVGFWLIGEGGYGWTPPQSLILSPQLAQRDQDKAGTLDLGTLAPRGPFFRFALALTF